MYLDESSETGAVLYGSGHDESVAHEIVSQCRSWSTFDVYITKLTDVGERCSFIVGRYGMHLGSQLFLFEQRRPEKFTCGCMIRHIYVWLSLRE